MSLFEVSLIKSYHIKTEREPADISINLEEFIDKQSLIKKIQEKDLSEIFEVLVREVEETDENSNCLECGKILTSWEIENYGDFCENCFDEEVDNEEEFE